MVLYDMGREILITSTHDDILLKGVVAESDKVS